MDTLQVKLPVFEGPLELLLHLIEKNKVNIFDIPIVEITEQRRGTADKRQVDGAKYGLAQSVGGIGSAVTVSILEAI